MARIFYSMAGEGRGHATRVRAMVELLRDDHELVLFAPGDAHALLAPLYRDSDARVERIAGLRFAYQEGHLNPVQTLRHAAGYLWRLPRLIGHLRRMIERERPDLIITDFEPALPRAARQVGVPFLSLDHQHFFVVNDLSALSWRLRQHAWLWGLAVRLYYTGQVETVVSSFFHAPLAKLHGSPVTPVGVLLRPEVLSADRRDDGHLLVYVRRFATPGFVAALADVGRPVRVYGLGERPPVRGVRFHAIDQRRFMEDLASSSALITTAGNQVVGESLFLGKPVLALPEPSNHEQAINAFFLRQSGAGDWIDYQNLTADYIRRFLDRLDEYRSRIDPNQLNGNPAALAAVRRHLPVPANSASRELAPVALN